MATERQILANRANARLSCGPKTVAGKLKSSRNAYRHGLSGPLRLDAATSAKVDRLANALADEASSDDRLTAAAEYARAQFNMLRIREARTALMETVESEELNIQELHRILALDRYERYCLTKRRRASNKLISDGGSARTKK